MSIDKNILKKLKSQLPKNYSVILSERCKCSQYHVINVMNGKKEDNHQIIEEAIEVVKETRLKSETLEKEIEKLCQTENI